MPLAHLWRKSLRSVDLLLSVKRPRQPEMRLKGELIDEKVTAILSSNDLDNCAAGAEEICPLPMPGRDT